MKCSRSILTAVAAVSIAIAANASITAAVVGYNFHRSAPVSPRVDHGSTVRDVDMMLREQERRNLRLQDLQVEEELRQAAPEQVDTVEQNVRRHYRAYRYCTVRGYTRSRLHACIEAVVEGGTYNIDY